jgi:hypothetical protein
MIERLILSAVLGTVGWHGLFPDPPQTIKPWQLQQKAKEKSLSGCATGNLRARRQKICVDDGGNIMLERIRTFFGREKVRTQTSQPLLPKGQRGTAPSVGWYS